MSATGLLVTFLVVKSQYHCNARKQLEELAQGNFLLLRIASNAWMHSLQAILNARDQTMDLERDVTGKLGPYTMFTQAPTVPELLNGVMCECQNECAYVSKRSK